MIIQQHKMLTLQKQESLVHAIIISLLRFLAQHLKIIVCIIFLHVVDVRSAQYYRLNIGAKHNIVKVNLAYKIPV